MFVDTLGDHLAVATDGKVLDVAKGYLEKNVIGRAATAAGDLEVVVYPSKVFELYRAEVEALLGEMAKDTAVSADVPDPQLRKALEVWNTYNMESTKRTITRMLELQQAVFAVGIDEGGLRMRFAMAPAPDSTMAKEQVAAFSRPVNPAFATKLPADTIAMMAARRDVAVANQMEASKEATDAMVKAYAAWTGKDPAQVKATYDGYVQKMVAHFGEHQALGVLAGGDVPLGIVVVNETRDAGARDLMREIFAKLKPETFLPKQAQGYVVWTYAADGAKAGGVAMDRLTFEFGPKLATAVEAEMKKDPDLAKVRDFLGGWKIVVDTAYLDGAQITVWAPKAEEKAAEKAVAAYRGEGALDRAAVDAVLRQDGRSWLIAGANVGGILAALRKISPEEMAAVPEKIGGDLDDVVLTGAVTQDGVSEWQLVFKQSFVDDVRKAIEAAQGGGGAQPVAPAPQGTSGAQP
ncbi:MAG: hypothetical protein D6705_13275 [Deltaproteobacteria bacterium]|nr:MAG: hypothetical protein D6705_13275 [Deltaproteobacteria bacterium]